MPNPRRFQSWFDLIAVGVCAVALLVWAGCNEVRDYQTLSYFFDGVPDPRASTQPAGGLATAGGAPLLAVSFHKPFVEKKCASCHEAGEGGKFVSASDPGKCMDCHQPVMTAHKVMHGAMKGNKCLWCHSAHQSGFAALLRTDKQVLCLQCHEKDLLSTTTPEHVAQESNCLDCHGGHGGERAGFLKGRG